MKNRIISLSITVILLVATFTICLTGCAENELVQDNTPLTMYVGLGVGSGSSNNPYLEKLKELLTEQGIEVEFVFDNTMDTSTSMLERIKNYDLPADIILTASATPNIYCQDSFLDLAAYTNLPDLFSSSKISDISVNGCVYQLPFATRLIGLTYNKTLFEEMGWEVPECFEDMVALKKKAEESGYEIAVTGGAATGHGFNYLMNLMGSQYLSLPDGAKWFKDFQQGNSEIDQFAIKAEYFERYKEAGLFGIFHDSDWNAGIEFSHVRALFYYNYINDTYSYKGYRYNTDGTIFGAKYGINGLPIVKESTDGEAVFVDGSYQFDDGRDEWKSLTHYKIPGAVILDDTYATMPWPTEYRGEGCFTEYENMQVALDKKLGQPEEKEKLQKAVKVLECLASNEMTETFSNLFADGYMSTKKFEIDQSRIYYDMEKKIQKGYLMPWYYMSFDTDSIVNVGQKVNEYIKGDSGVEIDDVLEELDYRNRNNLIHLAEIAATFSEQFDYDDCARLQCIANGISLQDSLDAAKIEAEVTVSILPYIENIKELQVGVATPVVQQRIYAENFAKSHIRSIISGGTATPVAVKMSGSEIKALVDGGFRYVDTAETEHLYKYSMVTKDGAELEDDSEYIVAIAPKTIANEAYDEYLASKKVIMSGEDTITGSTESGLLKYFESYKNISSDDLIW